jgi:class 3 adenylate cyclase
MGDDSLEMRERRETICRIEREHPQFRAEGYKPAPGTAEERIYSEYRTLVEVEGEQSYYKDLEGNFRRFSDGISERAARADALVEEMNRPPVTSKPEARGGEAPQHDEGQPKAAQSQRPEPPVEGARASVSQQGVKADRRRLAGIMFTDIVGYSALTQRNEALAQEVLNDHDRVLRAIFSKHSGTEVKTMGDGFLVEFASALDAVRCAVEIQQALSDLNRNRPLEKRFQVRIGLHVGDVIPRENDLSGDAVNIAARIVPLAKPGGICLSEDVARQIENKIDLRLQRMDRPELKNIQGPPEVYRVGLPR